MSDVENIKEKDNAADMQSLRHIIRELDGERYEHYDVADELAQSVKTAEKV